MNYIRREYLDQLFTKIGVYMTEQERRNLEAAIRRERSKLQRQMEAVTATTGFIKLLEDQLKTPTK